jgi:salicylate hydroxylase
MRRRSQSIRHTATAPADAHQKKRSPICGIVSRSFKPLNPQRKGVIVKCVIAGAGVAGCIVARALARVPGLEVICLEQVAASDHSESGTGLNVGPNAVRALLEHDPQLHAAVLARSYLWHTWRISLTDGTELFRLPLSQVADNPGIRIRWSELYTALRGEAAGLIRYDTRITAVSRAAANGRLSVEIDASGQSERIDDIDLLVAGDGRYSLVRKLLAGTPPITQHGVVIFRLLVPDTSSGLVDDYEQWFNGPNRLLAFRVPGEAIYIAGTFPIEPGAPVPDSARDGAWLAALYTPHVRPPSAQCAWMIEQIRENVDTIHWARLQESPPLYALPDAPVLLLGDAAHGMVPTLGQGATQAIEDACVAARLLEAGLREPHAEVAALITRFAALRDERIRFAMQFSLDASDTLMAGADPVAGTLAKTEPAFLSQLERLYRDITRV